MGKIKYVFCCDAFKFKFDKEALIDVNKMKEKNLELDRKKGKTVADRLLSRMVFINSRLF